jgi:iron complex outermembrane recepter protein
VPVGFVRSAFIPDSGAFDLARVEVLRGPQGTLYGANAAGGVVRVITNDADPNSFDLKARIFDSGTDGGGLNGGGDVAVNVPVVDGKLAVRGVVSYKYLSGWIDKPSGENANSSQLRDYRLKLAYLPTDDLSIDLSAWSSRDHIRSLSGGLENGTAPHALAIEAPLNNAFDAYGATLKYQFPQFTVTSATSYLDLYSYQAQDATPLGIPIVQVVYNVVTSYVWSEELLLNSRDTGPWNWTAGAFYRDAHDRYWDIIQPLNGGVTFFKDTSRSQALFGEIGRRFLDDTFSWTLGLRRFHDEVSTVALDPKLPPEVASYVPSDVGESFNSTTPRAVLSWYPKTNITVYSSFSEGFRSGMPQLYYVPPTIPPLGPDKLYNYEVGTKSDLLNHRISIDASLYYMRWLDVQQSLEVPVPGAGGAQFTAQANAANASGPGADLGLTVLPTDRLKLGMTFSWNDVTVNRSVLSGGVVEYNKGDRLNNSSKYTAGVFSSYSFPLPGGTSAELSAGGNYQSKQTGHGLSGDGLTSVITFGHDLFFAHAALSVRFNTGVVARLYGDNLTNESQALNGVAPGYPPTINEGVLRPRPRTIGVELSYNYK